VGARALPSLSSFLAFHNRTAHGLSIPKLHLSSLLSLIMISISLPQHHLVRAFVRSFARTTPPRPVRIDTVHFPLRLVRIDTADLSTPVRWTTTPSTAQTWSLKPLSILTQMPVSRACRQSSTCLSKTESARRRRLRHSA
jgi:hypothetical protein